MTFPVRSSQVIPVHERGHMLSFRREERFHEARGGFSGSEVMAFLNSSRDRSSGEVAEQEERKMRRRRKKYGGGFIGVNVDR